VSGEMKRGVRIILQEINGVKKQKYYDLISLIELSRIHFRKADWLENMEH
jgi:hypothetical protein